MIRSSYLILKQMTHRAFSLSCVLICLSLHIQPACAQDILKDANSVIVEARTEVLCKSMTQSIEKESLTITILNRKGLEAAHFFCGCDMFRSLQKFSGEIINADGQSVRKIKKSELQKSEYSSSLSTDDYFYFYECNYPSLPFTVKYEWEVKCNNGLIGYPPFIPLADFNQGVEKATYRIELPAGQGCRYRELNTQGKGIQVKESTGANGQQVIKATASKLSPIIKEPFGPDFTELFPRVYFAPSALKYDKSEGDMSNWQKYGEWQYRLLDGRDLLTEPFRAKLHELTAHCTTDRDKVKAIYDYLAKTTRYVSIQLGIGGLQPIAAADVCRTGFGDCKGLSNYTRAMLKELGIASTYTVISHQRASTTGLLQCQPDESRHPASSTSPRYALAGMYKSIASLRLCPPRHCGTRRLTHRTDRRPDVSPAHLSRLAEHTAHRCQHHPLPHSRGTDRGERNLPDFSI